MTRSALVELVQVKEAFGGFVDVYVARDRDGRELARNRSLDWLRRWAQTMGWDLVVPEELEAPMATHTPTPAEAAATMARAMVALVPVLKVVDHNGDAASWLAGFDSGMRLAQRRPALAAVLVPALAVDAETVTGEDIEGVGPEEPVEDLLRAFPEFGPIS